jgi:glycerol-3-phosphate O-acyltransferase/dihydroxyacetone phosphate acyltransferase
VVEYGRPIYVDSSTLKEFQVGGTQRRTVCNNLLGDIETSMRSVIVSTTDYDTLELIHTARRLYRERSKAPLDTSERQDLSRRFAEGYRRLLTIQDGKPPAKWQDLQSRLQDYREELRDLGIKDHQVPALAEEHLDDEVALDVLHPDADKVISSLQLIYNIIHLTGILALAAVPILLLNLPVGILAGLYSEARRKKALANSKVKVRGFDVRKFEHGTGRITS